MPTARTRLKTTHPAGMPAMLTPPAQRFALVGNPKQRPESASSGRSVVRPKIGSLFRHSRSSRPDRLLEDVDSPDAASINAIIGGKSEVPYTLRLYKKSHRCIRAIMMQKLTSQNTLYSTIVISGEVKVPPRTMRFLSFRLFIQPR